MTPYYFAYGIAVVSILNVAILYSSHEEKPNVAPCDTTTHPRTSPGVSSATVALLSPTMVTRHMEYIFPATMLDSPHLSLGTESRG
jgi:hypothetical protein